MWWVIIELLWFVSNNLLQFREIFYFYSNIIIIEKGLCLLIIIFYRFLSHHVNLAWMRILDCSSGYWYMSLTVDKLRKYHFDQEAGFKIECRKITSLAVSNYTLTYKGINWNLFERVTRIKKMITITHSSLFSILVL